MDYQFWQPTIKFLKKFYLLLVFFAKIQSNDIKDNLIKMIENKNILKSKIINGKKISNKFKWNINI